MKILEIIKNLLNLNKLSYAYANCGSNENLNKNNKQLGHNVMAFWTSGMQAAHDSRLSDDGNNSQTKPTSTATSNTPKGYPSDIISNARKLAKKIIKVVRDTPKSLNHYLSKEDIVNLALLQDEITTAMIGIKAVQLSNKENDMCHESGK